VKGEQALSRTLEEPHPLDDQNDLVENEEIASLPTRAAKVLPQDILGD